MREESRSSKNAVQHGVACLDLELELYVQDTVGTSCVTEDTFGPNFLDRVRCSTSNSRGSGFTNEPDPNEIAAQTLLRRVGSMSRTNRIKRTLTLRLTSVCSKQH